MTRLNQIRVSAFHATIVAACVMGVGCNDASLGSNHGIVGILGGGSALGGGWALGGGKASGSAMSKGGAIASGGDTSTAVVASGGGAASTGGKSGIACGSAICGSDEYCCNASCSLCSPLGSSCITVMCQGSGGSLYLGGSGGSVAYGAKAGVGGGVSKGGTGPKGSGGAGPMGGTSAVVSSSTNPNTGGAPVLGAAGAISIPGGVPGAVMVNLSQTKQEMAGFGINNTWAPAMTDADADALFDPTKGLGLSILRVGMGSNGSHVNSTTSQDIAKAKARGVKYIIGSTWSPPADCKDNNSELDGGQLLTRCYESWATTIARFAKDNNLYAMSPANEPDFASCGVTEPCNGNYASTVYTADEMVAFIKVVGPKLQNAGVKVIAPEASEWIHLWSNESATGSEPGDKNSSDPLKCGFPPTQCAEGKGYDYGHALYKDKDAWASLDIMGVHQYYTQVAEPWPAEVLEKKPVWMTEMSGMKWWPEQGPSSDINNGVAVAGWIHNALTVGEASAWIWWWHKAYYVDDNEGLILNNGTDTKRHYTLGNFSRFIRPGYIRVSIGGVVPKDVLLSAFKGLDGTVVVVAINKGSASANVPISFTGGAVPAALTPWVTSASDNLESGPAVSVRGGNLIATLGSMTVTTFVGQ